MKRYDRFTFGLIISVSLAFTTFLGLEAEAGCPGGGDRAPVLATFKTVDPMVIYLQGGGNPDEATVTLTVVGIGDFPTDSLSVDVVLVMDKSGSMTGQKMDDAKNAAMYFCSLLYFNLDQSSLVSFSSTADLDQELTPDHINTMTAILRLVAEGGTAIGSGINVAQGELTSLRRRPEAEPVIVLLSDGRNTRGPDPIVEANIAKNQGTTIYAIGLGSGVNELLLKEIASDPDSEYYYYAPTSADLDSIYGRVHGHISNIIAKQTFATEILAPNIHFVPGSYSIAPINVSGDTAVWSLGSIKSGDSWAVNFNITASDTGHLPVDDFPNAEVNFINCLNEPDSVPFPQAYIDVFAPMVGIEEELVRGERGIFMRIAPNPFSFTSTIQYSLNRASHVRLEVYNLMGEQIRTLVDEEKTVGTHVVDWNRRDDSGKEVSSGVYLLRIEAGDFTRTHKIVLLR